MRAAALAAALVLLATRAASAHTVIPGIGGFAGGLLHPLLVPSHTLTLIALGLMAGKFTGSQRVVTLAVFVAACAGAFGLIATAYSAAQAETLILCLGAAIGLVLAANLIPPVAVVAVFAAATAGGVMFDSVPPVPSVTETALSLTGTALAATALVAAAAWLAAALPPRIRPLAVRIAGSWIAASAAMVLALRIAA